MTAENVGSRSAPQGGHEVSAHLVVVHSAQRTEAEVFRAMREGYAAVVLVGIGQEPADVLLQVRPHLNDDEMAVVARALGF